MAVIKKSSFVTWFGTTAEKATFADMAAGDRFFATDTGLMYVYTGATWVADAEDVLSLGAGVAIIGKVGIDQTTDGTTNKVQSHLQVGNSAVTTSNPIPTEGAITSIVPYNVALTLADTEYSQAISAGCKGLSVGIQGGLAANNFRVAFVTNKVATPTAPYIKYAADQEYYETDLAMGAFTVYVASSVGAAVAQIIARY